MKIFRDIPLIFLFLLLITGCQSSKEKNYLYEATWTPLQIGFVECNMFGNGDIPIPVYGINIPLINSECADVYGLTSGFCTDQLGTSYGISLLLWGHGGSYSMINNGIALALIGHDDYGINNGVQFGLINLCGANNGLRIGLVNQSRERGTTQFSVQVGLINFDCDGNCFPILMFSQGGFTENASKKEITRKRGFLFE